MSLILIIGGYGGFGARLSRRLAAGGHRLVIGGRNGDKAARFCSGVDGAEPVVIDRNGDVNAVLARYRPDLVIDAAGPFQTGGFGVPQACIRAGIPYVDLADARTFVTGIGALDEAARAAGVAIVSGASSVPALSGAVARVPAGRMDVVRRIEIAISASNRGGAGASVAAAILSYVGKPIRLWRGRRWANAHGWQELGRETFHVAGAPPIKKRWVALADVPDHDLLPPMMPGRPSVRFRAGTELALHMLPLWLMSWMVRWGWVNSLQGATWLSRLQGLTAWAGGGRSAMSLTATGEHAGKSVETRWTLVAEGGDGLQVPTMAAALIAEDVLAGKMIAGASDASRLLTLDRFEPEFARLAIRHAFVARSLPPPLYARVMGRDFDALPPVVRSLHDVCGDGGVAGHATVQRGRNPLARLIAWVMRFPPAGDYPLHVAFEERAGVERWTRDFGGHEFSSRLFQRGGLVVEQFGPLGFGFALERTSDGLKMLMRRWTCFGLPLPLTLAPRIQAREWQEDDRFRLDVKVRLPLIGDVVHYAGWLKPE